MLPPCNSWETRFFFFSKVIFQVVHVFSCMNEFLVSVKFTQSRYHGLPLIKPLWQCRCAIVHVWTHNGFCLIISCVYKHIQWNLFHEDGYHNLLLPSGYSFSKSIWRTEVDFRFVSWLGHFFQNVISFSDAVHLMCNSFIWNWSNTMNVYSALWILMACDCQVALLLQVLTMHPCISRCLRVKPSWLSDKIWRHWFRSTLPKVMAWCLTLPSNNLAQCWLLICQVLWHSPQEQFYSECPGYRSL